MEGNVAIEGMLKFQGLNKFEATVEGMSVKEKIMPKIGLKGDIEKGIEEEEVVKWIGEKKIR